MSHLPPPDEFAAEEDVVFKSAAEFNSFFCDQVDATPAQQTEVPMTKLSAANSRMLRRHLREAGFTRNILDPETITDDQLIPSEYHDLPRVLREMEVAQVQPRIVPLGTPPDTQPYRGQRYEILFFAIQTPEFIQTVDRLRTYRNDLRQHLTENFLRDIQDIEDEFLISEVDEACGPVGGVGHAGMNQHQRINGQINHLTYPTAKEAFIGRRMPFGCYLVGHMTTLEFEKLDADQVGDELRSRIFKQGLKAMDDFVIGGVKHLATIKSNLVPRNWIYQFTEQEFLGNFCVLQDVQVYVSRKRDYIRTSAEEKIGITLANTAGLNIVEFQG